MKILAFEFSSPQRSVAVLDDQTVLAEQAEAAGQNIPPLRLTEQALAAAKISREQIDCLVVGLGPGSYTGIRGAIALAQGWQLASGVKVAGLSSVDVLMTDAQKIGLMGKIAAVFDAQRGEFYISECLINSITIKKSSPLRIVGLKQIDNIQESQTMVVGPEVRRWFPAGQVIFPSAATLGRLASAAGNFGSAGDLEPIYLRETNFIKAPPPRIIPTL